MGLTNAARVCEITDKSDKCANTANFSVIDCLFWVHFYSMFYSLIYLFAFYHV